MKKIGVKYVVMTLVILIIIVSVFLIISIGNANKKTIYYRYVTTNGIILTEERITIYDNGTVEKLYKADDEEKISKSKLSREELDEIRTLITNIENSELHLVENITFEKIMYDDVEEYINLNKKIILNHKNINYTNEYIEELDKSIGKIKESLFK